MSQWLERSRAARKCSRTLDRLAREYRADGNRDEAERLSDDAQWWLRKAEDYAAAHVKFLSLEAA